MRFFRKNNQDVDVEVFRTHTPDFYSVGQIVKWQDDPEYRITRIVSLSPTKLLDGTFAPCVSVRGVRTEEGGHEGALEI